MSDERDHEWIPTKDVRIWTEIHAKKQYQRKAGRLMKIGSDNQTETSSDLENLAQASQLV